MECIQCGEKIEDGETCFTAMGAYQCQKCDEKNEGTISLKLILEEMRKMNK